MRELNNRDIGLVSGGATFVGSVTGGVFIGANATGAGAVGGDGVRIINGKRIESNSSSHTNSRSISISYVPINSDLASHISSFWAGWFRNFFKYF
ncbi:hypothetical protein [Burkholderia ubonensis]|uniref:hypothetical protein n=1 Tax=Burkholderia ubonensis TaxID=101571 RepID=UPI0012F81994|nr:hypothetical protein [Burkholderia ubonensis]